MSVSETFHSRQYPEPRGPAADQADHLVPADVGLPLRRDLLGRLARGHWGLLLLGMLLAGPIVCGMSQAANDWCDRHVDAMNEPDRPIPSGRVPGRWGLWIALAMSVLALAVGWLLGPWGFGATVVGVIGAWAYSAEPIRLKRSGWWGPGLVGLSYEGLPWFTGAAVLASGAPSWSIVAMAALLRPRRAWHHDAQRFQGPGGRPRHTGSARSPWSSAPRSPPRSPASVMARPAASGDPCPRPGPARHALRSPRSSSLQIPAMRVLLRDPKGKAPWYNGTGVTLYVTGMMVTAFALRGLA